MLICIVGSFKITISCSFKFHCCLWPRYYNECKGKDDSLLISSFNCQGFKARNFDYVRKLFDRVDILCLQKHWLYDYEFIKFPEVLNNCNFFAKSSMKNNILVSGRPYGGVAIIYKSNLNFETEIVETLSDRLLICKINLNERNILLCNVYMPTNNIANNDKFSDILLEISSIQ